MGSWEVPKTHLKYYCQFAIEVLLRKIYVILGFLPEIFLDKLVFYCYNIKMRLA